MTFHNIVWILSSVPSQRNSGGSTSLNTPSYLSSCQPTIFSNTRKYEVSNISKCTYLLAQPQIESHSALFLTFFEFTLTRVPRFLIYISKHYYSFYVSAISLDVTVCAYSIMTQFNCVLDLLEVRNGCSVQNWHPS